MSSNYLSETIKRVMTNEEDHSSNESDVRRATAPHRKDFPYERDEEAQVTRRDFCNFLGLTSAALFLGAAGFAGKSVLDSRGVIGQCEASWTQRGGMAVAFECCGDEGTVVYDRSGLSQPIKVFSRL